MLITSKDKGLRRNHLTNTDPGLPQANPRKHPRQNLGAHWLIPGIPGKNITIVLKRIIYTYIRLSGLGPGILGQPAFPLDRSWDSSGIYPIASPFTLHCKISRQLVAISGMCQPLCQRAVPKTPTVPSRAISSQHHAAEDLRP